jgi:hypothetical protein
MTQYVLQSAIASDHLVVEGGEDLIPTLGLWFKLA